MSKTVATFQPTPTVVQAQPVFAQPSHPSQPVQVVAQPYGGGAPVQAVAQPVAAQPMQVVAQPVQVVAQPMAGQPVQVVAQPMAAPMAQVMAQPCPPAQPIQVTVPQGVNAGDIFSVHGPDGRMHRVQCPSPFPHRGVMTFTPLVAAAVGHATVPVAIPPAMQVTCPQGVGAGQQFEVVGPDGNHYTATCPRPFPRRGVFVFQPSAANKIDHTPLEQPFQVRVPPKGVGAGQRFFVRSPGGFGLQVECPRPFPRGGVFIYTPVARDLDNSVSGR